MILSITWVVPRNDIRPFQFERDIFVQKLNEVKNMKQLTGNEIRTMFLEFFKEKEHMIEPSAPLVPIDDDSLLWINSGVATLKKYFDGRVIPSNPKIVNAQKSIRTNDIENVGFTARHHTFFEMLGNFSIGDYFKKESIEFAWEFLTSERWIGFDPDLLYVTVHPEDEDAYNIWHDEIGLAADRITRIEGNFWDIGEGPCGPNSEIFYDRGSSYGQDDPKEEMYPGGENERYLEIWNLVFSEFNHNRDGSYTPLPKKNIDTGMGLERLVSVIQNGRTNFDTDLFMPIINELASLSAHKYGENNQYDTAFKVISDHIRTVAFAIADGALPSNEGRGYVLRRLIRRAVRFSKDLGLNEAFMYKLVDVVSKNMQDFYPVVGEKASFIKEVIKKEEERFLATLDDGIKIYDEMKTRAKASGDVLNGKDAFMLYDTYGFPYELTVEYAEADGLTVDEVGFKAAMEEQRERARKSRKASESMQVQSETLAKITDESKFVGYHTTRTESKLLHIIHEDHTHETFDGDDVIELVFDETPFYATSGGQVADKGIIHSEFGTFEVERVYKAPHNQHVHVGRITEGTLTVGESYSLVIEEHARQNIVKNHTATHLLHQALKDVLGEHVNQAGSLVESQRLRFDFSHLQGLTEQELHQVETIVNEKIYENLSVVIEEMPIDRAKEKGAMALFGEKYGEVVRVVDIDKYSVELCGGVHVSNTAEIGLFKIISETGIGAGIRRIEAVTSRHAVMYYKEKEDKLNHIADMLKVKEENIVKRIEQLNKDKKTLAEELKQLKQQSQSMSQTDIADSIEMIEEIKFLALTVEGIASKDLREMMDDLKSKHQDTVISLLSVVDDKVSIIVTVPKELTQTVKAGDIIKSMTEALGGKGGGRPDMAQGGGTNIEKLPEAINNARTHIKYSQNK